MVPGHSRTSVFGVEDRIGNELAHMIVFQPVDHLRAFATSADEARHPQLGQVLRYRRGGFTDVVGELVYRELVVDESPKHLNACGIGEHAEHFYDEGGLIVGQPRANLRAICIHAQIIAECGLP